MRAANLHPVAAKILRPIGSVQERLLIPFLVPELQWGQVDGEYAWSAVYAFEADARIDYAACEFYHRENAAGSRGAVHFSGQNDADSRSVDDLDPFDEDALDLSFLNALIYDVPDFYYVGSCF